MKTVLLLGGPAAGQTHEVHGCMRSILSGGTVGLVYNVVPMCSHGEVHWFGVLDGADPLALLIAGYAAAAPAERSAVCPPALAAVVYGTSHAEAAHDFSPTKNREGEAP
jgi:hypothetical protein